MVILGSYAPSLLNFRGTLIRTLCAAGHEVHAVAPQIDAETARRLAALGATSHSVAMDNSGLDPLAMLRTARDLRRLFAELKPHTVLSYTIKPVTLGSVAASRAGVPNVVALITGLGYAFTDGGGIKRGIARIAAMLLYRRALRRCDAVIFQNPDDERDLRRLHILPRDATVAGVNGSGVDLDHFAPAPLPEGARFLMVARLLRDKGVVEYAAAAAMLKARYPQANFALAGYLDPSPGSITAAELEAMTASGIDYLGPLDDVRPAIAAASIYVLPSYREGTPRSVLEAMAMGRPIITCDVPGCRQTVVEGINGFLVPPRDAAALATAMEKLIIAPERIAPMGAASLERARSLYDVDRVTTATIAAAGLA